MAVKPVEKTSSAMASHDDSLRASAREALARLQEVPIDGELQDPQPVLQLIVGCNGGAAKSIPLPAQVIPMVIDLLRHMARGEAVTLVSHQTELTTQEAAALLNVSRPYLIGLLDAGEISHRKVGKHRRISADELFRYQRQEQQKREEVLAELARQAQELNMGY